MKIIGTEKSVSFYIQNDKKNILLCEINVNASLTIKTMFTNTIRLDKIDKTIDNLLNPLILNINNYLSSGGYDIDKFVSLRSDNVEIIDADYEMNVKTSGSFYFSEGISSCISSVFNIRETNITNGIEMRFKRVSNYSKMDAQDAMIVDFLNQKEPEDKIIKGLMNSFQMDEKDARKAILSFINGIKILLPNGVLMKPLALH